MVLVATIVGTVLGVSPQCPVFVGHGNSRTRCVVATGTTTIIAAATTTP